jgi:DNA-binding SARP family transcriptional activator
MRSVVVESTGRRVVIGEKVAAPVLDALPRPRITDRTAELALAGIGYVHGAAGIGKTTAVAQIAESWPGRVAWVRLDHGDAEEARLVSLLDAALGASRPGEATIDDVIADLDSPAYSSTLIVLDDLHSIEGSDAELALHRLVRYRPPHVAVLMASRHECAMALRNQFGAVEPMIVDFEDLRFRLWEVGDLLRSQFDMVIAPAELHLLCRYADGWAAALRLFSVASRNAAPEHRSQMISGLRGSTGMLHDFLMSEVLSSLQPDERDFLIATSVLERVTAGRGDALLGVTNSRSMLRSIRAAGLFGDDVDGGESFRCHELLRTHLLGRLTEQIGAADVAQRHLDAATLVEQEGEPAEAIRYFARAGDLDAVRRILDNNGDELSITPGRWLEVLPPAMREQDPFVLLTSARQLVREGDLTEARARYTHAIALLETNDVAGRRARQERRSLEAWLLGETTPMTGWVGRVSALLRGGVATPQEPATGVQRAVADVLTGNLAAASVGLREAEETLGGLPAAVAAATRLVVDLLRAGDEGCSPAAIRRVQQAAKGMDARIVERVVGAVARGASAHDSPDALGQECAASNDHLGGGLVRMIDGVAMIHAARPHPRPFAEAAATFAEGGYDELAVLARCFEAAGSAAIGRPVADLDALESAARRTGSFGQLLIAIARAESATRHDPVLDEQVDRFARRFDLGRLTQRLRRTGRWDPVADSTPGERSVTVRVLGPFGVLADNEPIALGLTPLHREVLAFLAVHAGEWVHSDRMMAAFWPDKDDTRARRNLQVAISKVRLDVEAHEIGTIERDGARYSLVPSPTTTVDLLALRELLAPGSASLDERAEALEAAAAMFGEPVADLGAADWAVEARREITLRISRAAHDVVDALVRVDAQRAGRIAEAAVDIDPGADGLWHVAIDNAGGARSGQLRSAYEAIVDSYSVGDRRPAT